MNLKERIHMMRFCFIRQREIFKIFVSGIALAFLILFLWGIWKVDGMFAAFGANGLYDSNENDISSPITNNDDLNSWIIYESPVIDELFGDTVENDGALEVLATTIRPYSWMDQYNGIAVSNESERVFNIEKLLSDGSNISISKEIGPQILIVHTHGTESYNEGSLSKYYESDYLRTTDTSENVVAIGERVAEMLTAGGYSVIHDTTMHDDGNYNGSYASSRKAINEYLEEYPSIKIVLDVHRDTVITEKGVKYRPIWENNGRSAAQVMILLGAGGSKFANDHWEENLKLSLLIQQCAEEIYPDLMRPILMRSSLYNQDLSDGGILVEIGTCGNTFEEAVLGAECFSECLVNVLDSLCEGD